jgi:hypothetical protein
MPDLQDINLGAVNKDDQQAQIDSVVKQVNDHARAISNENRTKIIKDDSGTQRLLEGFQQGGFSNGDVGVKVSQVGIDVASATGDQLIWSTDFNNFKIVSSGTIDNVVDDPLASGTKNTVTLEHGLSFVPVVIASVGSSNSGIIPTGQYANTPFWYPIISFASWTGWGLWASVRTDSTTVYFDVGNYTNVARSGMGTWTFRYYILQETAT